MDGWIDGLMDYSNSNSNSSQLVEMPPAPLKSSNMLALYKLDYYCYYY